MGLDAHVLRRGVDSDDYSILTDCIVSKRLGNIAGIEFLREHVSNLSDAEALFPIILKRIIHNGVHAGDEIAVRDVPQLKTELALLARMGSGERVQEFIRDMNELCDASLLTENPIVF
jgi:hypothetical protein